MPKDLTMMLAKFMSREMIIDQLKEGIQKYELNNTDENYKHLSFCAHLILTKELVDKIDIEKLSADMEQMEKTREFFIPTVQ